MTYTFDPNLADEVSLVRFYIGDNNSEGHFMEDETIVALIAMGTWQTAVIACIRYIITQLSQPNFVVDWMEVTLQEARKGYEAMLATYQQEFGVRTITASTSITLPTRADSYQTDNDYSETGVE